MNKGISLRRIWLLAMVGLTLGLQGCALPTRLPAVPPQLTGHAEIPGMPDVRFVAGGDMTEFRKIAFRGIQHEREWRAQQGETGPLPPAFFLAISGGGDDGAFGAGLLNGWTAAGTRPEFKLVTGISTGALIAPFAFLGPKYDATLREIFTTTSPKDVLELRGKLAALFDDALADNRPLGRSIRKYVNEGLLREIAAEYAKGRFLAIGTVDLDARRGIIWDMGRIASYGGPKALDLFVKIMVASAAIPGAFPPTLIDVEADGKPYQEMHVDGGTMSQVFVYPVSVHLKEESEAAGFARERKLYVIRNARLDPEWAQVERRTMSIAQRAISSLIYSQGLGDLYRIYATAHRDGVDFNLAFIPPTFNAPHREEFDTGYMRKLYDVGYAMAAKGFPWVKAPPGFRGGAGCWQRNGSRGVEEQRVKPPARR
ncbi:MAG: patatin-like phospholipase family protein [Desulfobacteraceae bacterium]|nr:patatin-like phospholipase family protein [Desulfobacteraceae bacterium]